MSFISFVAFQTQIKSFATPLAISERFFFFFSCHNSARDVCLHFLQRLRIPPS